MPINYSIDSKKQLVIAIAGNRLTKEDLTNFILEIKSLRKTFKFNLLFDSSAILTFDSVTPEIMKSLTQIAANADTPETSYKLAIVTASDTIFSLSRVYEVFRTLEASNNAKVSVFRSFADAISFLDKY